MEGPSENGIQRSIGVSGFSLCSPGSTDAHYVDLADLKLTL